MLTQLRALLAHHTQAAMSSLISLSRQPLATGMTVVVLAITLTLPVLLWVVNDNLVELTKNWKRGGHISLYIDMQGSHDLPALLTQIKQVDEVGDATLKTPEEGLLELQKQEGMQDLMLNLPENPLPAVINVMPAVSVDTPAKLEALYERLKAIPGIEDAKLDMQWVTRLYALLDFATQLTHGLIYLLSIAVIFIVGNTLRLVIHKRQEEIQVLKLIGASDAYIMRPFLYAGIWYGLASALLAVMFVVGFMTSLKAVLTHLMEAYQMHLPFFGLSIGQAFYLLCIASLLGWLGARFSVKHQLSMIEP